MGAGGEFDETAAQRRLKLPDAVDEHAREALAIEVDHSIDADSAVEVVEQTAAQREAPKRLRTDNGPQPAAGALRDWCPHSHTDTAHTEPGAP